MPSLYARPASIFPILTAVSRSDSYHRSILLTRANTTHIHHLHPQTPPWSSRTELCKIVHPSHCARRPTTAWDKQRHAIIKELARMEEAYFTALTQLKKVIPRILHPLTVACAALVRAAAERAPSDRGRQDGGRHLWLL